MKYTAFISLFCVSLLCTFCKAQSVVVNGYINFNDYRDEWTELVVVGDDVDMRNWTIRDNNSTQSGWQVPVRFNNISLFQHLRRGTVIMLWHRLLSSTGATHTTDANLTDGYLELSLNDATYFNGGDFATNNSMNLASTGDIVELRNSANVHIHAIGHYQSSSGSSWTAMAQPKLNHNTATSTGDAVYACPGNVITDYDGPQSNTLTARNVVTTTFGLPNICGASSTGNRDFWLALRQPDITAQSVTPSSVTPGMPGTLTFSWASATDLFPADNSIGYLIIRNTSNSFPANPSDGYTYSIGDNVGPATVVGILNGSANNTFTDNTVMNGNKYYYRVYAFRYFTDNINGNSYNTTRGRAYNETNFVFVNFPYTTPLAVELVSFSAHPQNKTDVQLKWITASEQNSDYFTLEKSFNGKDFTFLTKVKAAGSSNAEVDYEFNDVNAGAGTIYYRLFETDLNGNASDKRLVAVKMSTDNEFIFSLFPNPVKVNFYVMCQSDATGNGSIELTDYTGRLVMKKQLHIDAGGNTFAFDISAFGNGMYVATFIMDSGQATSLKLIKQ